MSDIDEWLNIDFVVKGSGGIIHTISGEGRINIANGVVDAGDFILDLNDFSATVIGMVRDDVPFNQVLSGNIVYIGSANASNNVAYSQTDNDHYV